MTNNSTGVADTLAQYYERAFRNSPGGNIYKPMSLLERVSHDRKMHLLDAIPLPSLKDKTVVDYGVGAWGFGCVFPKLKKCRNAISIDISEAAIELTRQICLQDADLKHANMTFATGSAYDIPVPDESVDVFFAGECIEHIEETQVFLEEVWRLLKPDGYVIFTTPNREPFVYRNIGLDWCTGYEHVALMNYQELAAFVNQRFEITLAKGFNQTLHPAVDDGLDEETARVWAGTCENEPANASGLITVAKRKNVAPVMRARVSTLECEAAVPHEKGSTRDVELTTGCNGRLVQPGASMSLRIPEGATRCQLIFWAHAWSGTAEVLADGKLLAEQDLFSHVGGARRLGLQLSGQRLLTIRSVERKRPESKGFETIFVRAVFVI